MKKIILLFVALLPFSALGAATPVTPEVKAFALKVYAASETAMKKYCQAGARAESAAALAAALVQYAHDMESIAEECVKFRKAHPELAVEEDTDSWGEADIDAAAKRLESGFMECMTPLLQKAGQWAEDPALRQALEEVERISGRFEAALKGRPAEEGEE